MNKPNLSNESTYIPLNYIIIKWKRLAVKNCFTRFNKSRAPTVRAK